MMMMYCFSKQQRHTCLLPRIQIRSSIDTLRVPDIGDSGCFRRICMPNKPGTPQKRKASSPSPNGDGSSSKKKRGSAVKGFGWKQQKACVVCNHFRAKKQCIFQKCRRCCGKDGSKRCPYHHEEYEEEKRILALANSNRTVSASE